ncbi:MAG TPA: kelch repeat-containing protein, partial [Candidatus Angelobacter sp.]|nr:kelch repeat-containing protein [Candidatus Angelobacter sp.]
QWTWMSGSTTGYAPGVYGTLGVSAPGNVPGARENAAAWTDKSGNLWLFGGWSGSGGLDDVWEFSTTSKQWTWISGSNTTNELPVFGSLGVAATSNTPGARTDEVIWSDNSGNVWMFGGSMDGDLFNDLWKYNLSQKEWTWVGGSNHMQGPGVYGTQGVPAASNIPGARVDAVGWTDSSGDFWLLGGNGYTSAGGGGMPNEGALEDLWRFDPSSGQWTWMGGSAAVNKSAIYGTQGTPSESNTPGGLYSATSWTDGNGNFWLFGGATLGLAPAPNVLWRYQP